MPEVRLILPFRVAVFLQNDRQDRILHLGDRYFEIERVVPVSWRTADVTSQRELRCREHLEVVLLTEEGLRSRALTNSPGPGTLQHLEEN